MGGTFDPIHLGHLRIAEEAREQLKLDRVYLVPNKAPVHRVEDPAGAEDRYAMAVLATVAHPCMVVSRAELDRDTESYSIETVEAFREALPHADLFFIVGADELIDLPQWHRAQELVRLCTFAVAPRGEERAETVAALPEEWRERVVWLEMPLVPFSASDVRERLEAGRSIHYLTPEPVVQYIEKRGLYGYGSRGC
jgi:nicotinate-nucleotide adenylyltransferase